MDLKFSIGALRRHELELFLKTPKPREDCLGRHKMQVLFEDLSLSIAKPTVCSISQNSFLFIDEARNLSAGNFPVCPILNTDSPVLPPGL